MFVTGYKSSAVAEKRRHAECASVYIQYIFGLKIYNHIQKLSSCASVNARCNFVTDRCHQIGVHAVTGMKPIKLGIYFKSLQYLLV